MSRWPHTTLGELADFQNGAAFKPSDWVGSGTPIVRIKNLTNPSGAINRTTKNVPEKFHIKQGDLLYSWSATLGAFFWDGEDAYLNQHIFKVTPVHGADKDFLYFLLGYLTRELNVKTHGSTMKHVTKRDFEQTKVPLPPLAEQRRIVDILNRAEGIRRLRREAQEKARQLIPALFVDMFGDPTTNPKGWPKKSLDDLICGKPNNGIFKKKDAYGEGLPVVWVEELYRGYHLDLQKSRRLEVTPKEVEKYGLKHGDILFCRSSLVREGIGFPNVFLGESDSALFECHLIRISPDQEKLDPMFLNAQLRTDNLREQIFQGSSTVTMTTIGQKALLKLSLMVPPLSYQHTFADRLAEIQGTIVQQDRMVEGADRLQASLMAQVFDSAA